MLGVRGARGPEAGSLRERLARPVLECHGPLDKHLGGNEGEESQNLQTKFMNPTASWSSQIRAASNAALSGKNASVAPAPESGVLLPVEASSDITMSLGYARVTSEFRLNDLAAVSTLDFMNFQPE